MFLKRLSGKCRLMVVRLNFLSVNKEPRISRMVLRKKRETIHRRRVVAMRRLIIGVCLITLPGPVAATAQENWPQFRGPGSAGVSKDTGLPDRWSATENIVWRTEIPGRGWSCPIVWGDRIILTTAIIEGQEEEASKGIYPVVCDLDKPSKNRRRCVLMCFDL